MVEFKDLMPERFSHQSHQNENRDDWSNLPLHQAAYGDHSNIAPPPNRAADAGRVDPPLKAETGKGDSASVNAGTGDTGKTDASKVSGSKVEAKKFDADSEASKVIDLAKARLDTIDNFTGYATGEGIAAAKALANELASLTPAQAADVNTSMIAQYQNFYPTWTPVPTGMVNEQGQSIGMEIRASKLDIWPGPQSLQVLDNGKTITVRRQTEPAKVVDGKELPAVYVVDAQAARS
jgi:hypothetical protein